MQRAGQSGNIEEGMNFFSSKHKIYDLKMEFSILLLELVISFSYRYPGSVSDVHIFTKWLNGTSRIADRDKLGCT